MSISLILQTLLSTAAVMATVLLILFVVTGIGLLTSFSWQQGVGVRIRSAIWLGWFWVAVYVSTAHLFFAMKPPVAVPLIIAGLMGWFLLVRKSGFPHFKLRGQPWWIYGAWAALFALFVLQSNQTLRAPIYHSDAGIYRIPYSLLAATHKEIPGIANLNPEFGFGHITDTFSGLVGSLFLFNEGFRFLNLLFVLSALVDIYIRFLSKLKKKYTSVISWPNFLAVSFLLSMFLVGPWSSIWIATPIVDLPTAILFGFGIIYALESLTRPSIYLMAPALAAMIFASWLRQANLIAFLGIAFLLLMQVLSSKPLNSRPARQILPNKWASWWKFILLLGGALGSLSVIARSVIRSGSIFYPALRGPFAEVDWAVPESQLVMMRAKLQTWSIAWAVQSPEQVFDLTGWSLLAAIAAEPVFQITIGGLVISLVVLSRGYPREKALPWKSVIFLGPAILWISSIAVVAAASWVARDPRYFWGPLLIIGLLPLSFAISSRTVTANRRVRLSVLAAATVALCLVFAQKGYVLSAAFRPVSVGGLGVFASQPVPKARVNVVSTLSGDTFSASVFSPNCWLAAPPCSYTVSPNLSRRGATLSEGFKYFSP